MKIYKHILVHIYPNNFKLMKKATKAPSPKKIARVTKVEYGKNPVAEFSQKILDGEKNSTSMYNLLLESIFDGSKFKENAQKIFENVKNSKAVCARIFVKGDIAFKCLDCEKDPTCVICKECYENGDHKGHRVIINKNVSGCCDCGDPDAWNEKGFCKNHPGYANFKPTYSIDDIPAEYKERFLRVYEEAFFNLFTLIEEFAINELDSEDKFLSDSINSFAYGVLNSLDFCGEKTMALYVVLCNLLGQKLSAKGRKLYIKTGNLKSLEFAADSSLCELSYLECIFAYARFFSDEIQKKFEELAIKLFIDYDFKKYIAQTFIKMIHYTYYIDKEANEIEQTNLTGLNVQLFTAEEFAVIAIDSPYFSDFMDLLISLIETIVNNTNYDDFCSVLDYKSFFDFVLQKKLGRVKLIENLEMVTKLIKVVSALDYAFRIELVNKTLYTPDIIQEKTYLFDIDIKLLQLIDYIFIEISSILDQYKKNEIIAALGNHFIKLIKQNLNLYKINKDYVDKSRTMFISTYRAFGLFLKNVVERPTFNSINTFITETLKLNPKDSNILFEHIFDVVLRVYGFVQDNEKKAFERASVLFDDWCSIYRNPKLRYFDIDLYLLQISLIFSNPLVIQSIFCEYYSLNPQIRNLMKSIEAGTLDEEIFASALKDISNLKNKDLIASWLDDMFSFIITLGTDRISLANLFYQKDKLFEYKKHSDYTKKVYKDLFINFMQKNYKMDLKTIQDTLSQRIIYPKIDFESSMNEIATFSTSSKQFILKEEFKDNYEPYSLAKDPKLHFDINGIILTRLKKDKKELVDMIAGNNSFIYKYEDSLNRMVLDKIFSTKIVEFGIRLLTAPEVPFKVENIVRSILKLVHMKLDFLNSFPDIDASTKFLEIIDSNKFMEKLVELSQNNSLEEIYHGLQKIKKLYELLKNFDPNNVSLPEIKKEISDLSTQNKKELARMKMESIKKQFSQKQENFLKKFKSDFTEETEKETTNDHICNICHLEINTETELYGAPGFFGHSSIYTTSIKQIKKDTVLSLKKFKGQADVLRKILLNNKPVGINPVILTCSHYLHKECFDKTGRKNSLPNTDTTFYFNNQLEYTCTFCKFLANTFIIIRDDVDSQESKNSYEIDLENVDSNIYKLVSDLNPVKIESNKVDDIFNDVIHLELLKTDDSKQSSSSVDDFNLKSFDSLFYHGYNTINFLGVTSFLKKQLKILRSIKLSYAQFYQSYDLKTKYSYFNDKKTELLNFLELFTVGKITDISDKTKELMFNSYNEPVALNCDSDAFVLENLQHMVIASSLDYTSKKYIIKKYLSLSLFHKLVQIYIKKKIIKDEFSSVSVENFLSILDLEVDAMLKMEIASSLLGTLRKFFCFSLVNFACPQEVIDKINNQDFLSDMDEFKYYCKNSILDLDVNEFFSRKVFDILGIKIEILNQWLSQLDLGSEKNIISDTLLISDIEISFQFPELPPNFLELTSNFMERKCSLCKKHPEVGGRCLCLICREVICSSKCQKSERYNVSKPGNLNNHAKLSHGGSCCFLNTEDGRLMIVNAPKNVLYKCLYADKFGYEVDQKKKDWREFTLDKNIVSTLREKVILEMIPQEIVYSIMNSGTKMIDNLF